MAYILIHFSSLIYYEYDPRDFSKIKSRALPKMVETPDLDYARHEHKKKIRKIS